MGFHEAFFLPRPVAVFFYRAFVKGFFAFGNGEIDFDVAVFPVEVDGHEGVAVAFGGANQGSDFTAMEQQFACA